VDAVALLNKTIAEAVSAGDNGSRDLLERILLSEEEHIDWIETQIELVKQVGEQPYLAAQARE
jgi:bacterioferritin